MVDVCPSHDDRLTEAATWYVDVAAARPRATSASSTTTAAVGGCCIGAGIAAES